MKVYFEHIYEHIGYLFYAIACDHGKLNAVTFDKLRSIVDQQWHPFGNGVTVESNLVSYLQSGMRNAYDARMSSQEAFTLFSDYYSVHKLPFGSALRNKIFASVNVIASEFSGNGKRSDSISTLGKMLEISPMALT